MSDVKAEWRSADEAPDGWHRTYRVGESGATWAHCCYEEGTGRIWTSPTGHDTVANGGSYAAPTHYLHVEEPPLPGAAPTPSAAEGDAGAPITDEALYAMLYPFVGDDGLTRTLRGDVKRLIASALASRDADLARVTRERDTYRESLIDTEGSETQLKEINAELTASGLQAHARIASLCRILAGDQEGRRVAEEKRDALLTVLGLPIEKGPCFCMGPRPGETQCPCAQRAIRVAKMAEEYRAAATRTMSEQTTEELTHLRQAVEHGTLLSNALYNLRQRDPSVDRDGPSIREAISNFDASSMLARRARRSALRDGGGES